MTRETEPPSCWKIPFKTKRDAQKKAKQQRRLYGHDLAAYHCADCGQWHTTSKRTKFLKARYQERADQWEGAGREFA